MAKYSVRWGNSRLGHIRGLPEEKDWMWGVNNPWYVCEFSCAYEIIPMAINLGVFGDVYRDDCIIGKVFGGKFVPINR